MQNYKTKSDICKMEINPFDDNYFMKEALKEAEKALGKNEVPVGAVLVDEKSQKILSLRHNEIVNQNNPLKHAEILVIEEACKLLKSRYLVNSVIYITLEPCVMCAAAISEARVKRIYFGAYDEKKGSIENGIRIFSNKNYFKPEIYGGVKEKECAQILKSFFSSKRKST